VTKDDMEIVSALQLALADKVGSDRFELWFGANTRLTLVGDALTVSVPNQFFQEWLRNNFRREIEASCLETLGKSVPVSFHVDRTLADVQNARAPKKPLTVNSPTTSSEAPRRDSTTQPRRRFANLESFVLGSSNRLAHVSAQTVAQRLGSTSPLLIHGPTGVGKSHLLEGIWTAAKRANPGVHAVYLSAEQFTGYFLEALHGAGLPSFRRKYRGVELLIIDDVQFFAGKKATLGELLHTIDTLLREQRQLVFAADRSPGDMPELGPELMTRFQGGLVCPMQAPDFETRLGIVRQMAVNLAIDVPVDVQTYIAGNINTHARALAGALKRLELASIAHSEPITMSLAEQALAETIRANRPAVRLVDIESAVCNAFGLEPKSLQAKGKGKHVDHPRMLAMWLARKHTRAALSEIGSYFGRRSHSTVISAQKRVSSWMSEHAPLHLADRTWSVEEAIRRVEEALRAG
jgi:chromosomal replication initiator protein